MNNNQLVFLEKEQILDKIRNEMGEERATAFLESIRKSYGLGKELFDEFISVPDSKYAHARFILNKHLFNPNIKASSYIGYLRETNLVSNLREAPQRVVDSFNLGISRKKFVIFLDGDNLSNLLSFKKLKELSLFKNSKETLSVEFHVCLVLTKDIINDSMMGYENEKWLSIIYSETKEKDAADNCITFLMGRIDLKLENIDCDFILVTRDHFYKEMTCQFDKYFERICYHSNTMDDLAELMENNNYRLKKRPIPLSLEKLCDPISSVDIMKLDNGQQDYSPEFLIEFFKKFWTGSGKSQASFCKTNNLDPTNFSKHINRKKNNTRFDAVLLEYYNSFKNIHANCNFVVRVNQNVMPIHIFRSDKNRELLIIQSTNLQNLIEIATEKSQHQSHEVSLFDTTFILEIVDRINVNVTLTLMRD